MLAVLIGKVIIELFFVIFYQLPFNISKEDVFKCLKVGSAGVGCWFCFGI